MYGRYWGAVCQIFTASACGLRLCGLGVFFGLLLIATPCHPGTEHYEYDSLGRLIRWTDANGVVTEYVYDAVGNILEVRQVGAVGPPEIASVSPPSIRLEESKDFTVIGRNLTASRISAADALQISNLRSTSTQVTFRLTASGTVVAGARTFSLTTATGSASFQVTINPALPKLLVEPGVLAMFPGEPARQVTIRLSGSDNVLHAVSLAIPNNNLALVAPTSVTFLAGQSEVKVTVTPLAKGTTSLKFNSATLGPSAVPIYVEDKFTGQGANYAPLVGVVRLAPAPTNPPTFLAAPLVGVIRLP